jgi:hypothetical protein
LPFKFSDVFGFAFSGKSAKGITELAKQVNPKVIVSQKGVRDAFGVPHPTPDQTETNQSQASTQPGQSQPSSQANQSDGMMQAASNHTALVFSPQCILYQPFSGILPQG